MLSPVAYYWLVIGGIGAGAIALLLRGAETRYPAPGDIAAKGGLGHMLVGVMATLGLIAITVAAVWGAGIVLPAAIGLVLAATGRFVDFGARLAPLYPFQITLGAMTLIIALVLWINIITLLGGSPNV